MPREKSNHFVTLLKIDKLQDRVTDMMQKNGKIDSNTKMEAGWTPFGIAEKDGKHYLFDHEGCGSFEPFDDTQDCIDWYEHTYKEGKLSAFNMMPTARSSFVYQELVDEKIITKKRIRLDTFIRTGGTRLEGNYSNVERFLSGKIDKHGHRIKQELKTA